MYGTFNVLCSHLKSSVCWLMLAKDGREHRKLPHILG